MNAKVFITLAFHFIDYCLSLGFSAMRFVVGLTKRINEGKTVFKQSVQFHLQTAHIAATNVNLAFKTL